MMHKILRVSSGLLAVVYGAMLVGWLIDPPMAAANLGMGLLETGVGLSTQIGDFTAFFFAVCVTLVLGVVQQKAHWLYSACFLLGGAAVFRTAAFFFHGAVFPADIVALEVASVVILMLYAMALKRQSG